MIVKEVLYGPDLRANLLSVKKMARAGMIVTFSATEAIIKKEAVVIAKCPLRGDFYELDLFFNKASANMVSINEMKSGDCSRPSIILDNDGLDAATFEQEGDVSDLDVESSEDEDPADVVESNALLEALPSQLDPGQNLEMATMRHGEWERMLSGKYDDLLVIKSITAGQCSPDPESSFECRHEHTNRQIDPNARMTSGSAQREANGKPKTLEAFVNHTDESPWIDVDNACELQENLCNPSPEVKLKRTTSSWKSKLSKLFRRSRKGPE